MTPRTPQQLIEEAFRKGDFTAWFEGIYANAQQNGTPIPWGDQKPAELLVSWAEREALDGHTQRALVVGCGLGDDAEYLAERGFAVTAFDISPTAIEMCHARWTATTVDYQVADLLNAPPEWHEAFDFVLESRTLQALPWQMTEGAIRAISGFVKPLGTCLVLCLGRDPDESKRGIPWHLSRQELAQFGTEGLQEVTFEDFTHNRRLFRIQYTKGVS